MEEAGQKLKRIRERLNLRFRDVEEASAKIAARRGNDEYIVALSRLADIENKGTIPSFYRLYSLCAIYKLDLPEVLTWYGVSVATLPGDSAIFEYKRTHLAGFRPEEGDIQVPIALDRGIDMSRTVFLSRMIQRWGVVPLMLLHNIDLKDHRYGFVGTEDWFMYPLIQPGSLLLIDDTRRDIVSSGWTSEFDRPIYFLEHREGYAFGWCSLNDREQQLILQPHPASKCNPQMYLYPQEIEVIGQVTGVAMNLDPEARPPRHS